MTLGKQENIIILFVMSAVWEHSICSQMWGRRPRKRWYTRKW